MFIGLVFKGVNIVKFVYKSTAGINMRVSLNYIDLVAKNYELSKKFQKSVFSIDFTAHLMLKLYTVCIIL